VKKRLQLAAQQATPARADVLAALGVPEGGSISDNLRGLLEQALETYAALAKPRAVWLSIPVAEFGSIYAGEGDNAYPTPLEVIYPRASRLALFALTLGAAVSVEIDRLLRQNEAALGCVLDVTASSGAERAQTALEQAWLTAEVGPGWEHRVLAYSPGYCGWHVSGQRKLFERLRPESIGITLNAACLMQPLKSISGVLVAGPPSIHEFDRSYAFCGDCDHQTCRQRIAAMPANNPTNTDSGGR
jgi:hypothetical protein